MRLRTIITTAALVLLLVCVYVNLTYLPQISKHRAEQHKPTSGTLENSPSQRHEPTQNAKFEIDKKETKPVKQTPKDNHHNHKANEDQKLKLDEPAPPNSKLAKTVTLAKEDILPPILTEELPILDINKVISARIEV
jgi:hypothetical protein